MNRKPKSVPCQRDGAGGLATYREVVAAYIRDHRRSVASLRTFYRERPTLELAIEYAAQCKLPSGKRHPHQYRASRSVLDTVERRLLATKTKLRQCGSFAELHAMVQDRIGSIRGIGALTVYDVAYRLGAHLRLEPESVYLHAGTAKGANALGLGRTAKPLAITELPSEFLRLTAHDVEECLCLYKDELSAIGSSASSMRAVAAQPAH